VNYTMEVMDSGIIVKGPIPLTAMATIEKMAKAAGFDQLDIGLAQALRATIVITNADGSAKLRAEVEEANKGKSAEEAWICGCDTGISSRTIFAVMRGTRPEFAGIPYDAVDFGRCYRLLQRIPAWRSRLGEVAAVYPKWAPLVERWDELTTLFEAKEWKAIYQLIETCKKISASA
jgi:hypothetical protein